MKKTARLKMNIVKNLFSFHILCFQKHSNYATLLFLLFHMKTMFYIGLTVMPPAYILKRWTWSVEENLVEETPGKPAELPEESRKKMSLATVCNEFKSMALYGNQTEDGKKIIKMHLKNMKKDLASLKRETEKRAKKVDADSTLPTNSSQHTPNKRNQQHAPTNMDDQHQKSGPETHPAKHKKVAPKSSTHTYGPRATNSPNFTSSDPIIPPTTAASS